MVKGIYWKKKLAPREDRIKELKTHYAENPIKDTHFDLQWAVIHCYYRNRLTVSECAEILGVSEHDVTFSIDCVRQNAQ